MACKLYGHLENSPDIIVNGFRHAGIHQALNLLTDIDDSNLINYSRVLQKTCHQILRRMR